MSDEARERLQGCRLRWGPRFPCLSSPAGQRGFQALTLACQNPQKQLWCWGPAHGPRLWQPGQLRPAQAHRRPPHLYSLSRFCSAPLGPRWGCTWSFSHFIDDGIEPWEHSKIPQLWGRRAVWGALRFPMPVWAPPPPSGVQWPRPGLNGEALWASQRESRTWICQ